MMSYWIAKITYHLTWIPWYLVLKFFLNYKVIYKDPGVRKLKGPFILAANHSSWLDPFILSSAVFPIFSQAFPIRFATHPAFFLYIHTALFVRMYGSFQARRKIGLAKVLAPAVEFLKKGQVVGIFPEGKKRHLGRQRMGRRGAAYLAIKVRVPILPARIEGVRGLTMKDFFMRKRHAAIYVGQPFYLPKELNDANNINYLNMGTESIMKTIKEISSRQ